GRDELDQRLEGFPVPDIDAFHAWASLSLARTLADEPANREEALRRLGDAIQRLTGLTEKYTEFPHYRDTLAESLAVRAHLHAVASRPVPAESDALAARALLQGLCKGYRQIPDRTNVLATAAEPRAPTQRQTGCSGEAVQP